MRVSTAREQPIWFFENEKTIHLLYALCLRQDTQSLVYHSMPSSYPLSQFWLLRTDYMASYVIDALSSFGLFYHLW